MKHKIKNSPTEGTMVRMVKKITSHIPSDIALWTAMSLMSASMCLKMMRKPHMALLAGQWVSPVLLMGIYNKIVKTDGHDQEDTGA